MTHTPQRILFIGGSMNQTTQMHQIANELTGYERWFTPYYTDGLLDLTRKAGLLEPTVLGNKYIRRSIRYFRENDLAVDFQGRRGGYDLVVTSSDLVVPRNIRASKIVLVQEGMTDPEGILFHLVKRFRFLPRWITSTAATGLSDAYERFCVASEGYRDLFIQKGIKSEKIVVTGIPNFDNCARYLKNAFPHKHYVLVCTSDTRETWAYENRKRTILRAVNIARGRQLIFKLHPNENVQRATAEINRWAPGALIYATGKTEEMIANCDVLITRFSTTVYVGLALGKEVYSEFDVGELRRLTPAQNARAAANIADVCRAVLEDRTAPPPRRHPGRRRPLRWKSKRFQTSHSEALEER
jgi:hypothetical protein